VFRDLGGDRDIVAWNAMINGYVMVMHGDSREALEAFGQLRAQGLWPTDITFVGVLNACNHSGFMVDLLGQRRRLFRAMEEEYGIQPKVEHYGCMVDLLGCTVRHEIPAVVYSNGGNCGNYYHDFNDNIIPLQVPGDRGRADQLRARWTRGGRCCRSCRRRAAVHGHRARHAAASLDVRFRRCLPSRPRRTTRARGVHLQGRAAAQAPRQGSHLQTSGRPYFSGVITN
jgi:hypothetical protein